MKLYGEFEEKGYQFKAYFPENANEGIEFKIEILLSGNTKKAFSVPMVYEPRFGVDDNDAARLEVITDEIIAILPPPERYSKDTDRKIDEIVVKHTPK
jgi:hypothetical protein